MSCGHAGVPAQPDFDDSGWGPMDLTPPPGSRDPIFGTGGFVPGWTARGYRGQWGYAWYRLRVDVHDESSNAAAGALALKLPDNVDDAYQVYVNGTLVGEFGHFTAGKVTIYGSQPRAFQLPASIRNGPMTIAIRMWMDASTPLTDPDAGGLHGPPVLGENTAIARMLRLDWDAVDRALASYLVQIAILFLVVVVGFTLFWLDRSEPAYLWLGLTCTASLLYAALFLELDLTTWLSSATEFLLLDAFLVPVMIGLWVLFWGYWFRLEPMGRLHCMAWGLVVVLGLSMTMLRAPLYGHMVPVGAAVWLSPFTVALKLLLGVLLVWVTWRGIRRNTAEGLLALPAVILLVLALYYEELLVMHVQVNLFPFGFSIGIDQMATMLSSLIITGLLLRRFLHGQREREKWRLEIEQARQLQQMLIPEELPKIAGLTIESDYRPARVVGGDFFQIIPDASDGSVLIVAGDVAGKGLQAGMLVALIVGAIRNQAESSSDPMQMLEALNRRLRGHGHAAATCVALRIDGDGRVTLANAGHLPPYLNGEELPMEGALPLGMIEGAEFSVMKFQLTANDRLLLMSDGIAEAQDEHGQLFGFERIQAMVRQSATVAALAGAAQRFGQEDDISVLSITRTVTGNFSVA
jgi:hypothetical protein